MYNDDKKCMFDKLVYIYVLLLILFSGVEKFVLLCVCVYYYLISYYCIYCYFRLLLIYDKVVFPEGLLIENFSKDCETCVLVFRESVLCILTTLCRIALV